MSGNAFSRRNLIKGAVAGAVLFGAGTEPLRASAQPSMEIINGASYYHFALGSFQVTAISDGTLSLSPELFGVNANPSHIENVLDAYGLPSELAMAPMTTTLVNTSENLILFDTGIGPGFGIGGAIPTTLRQLGISTHDIDAVVFTHAHVDHIGGTLDTNGQLAFSNAQIYFARREWDFWMNATAAETGLDEGTIQFAQQHMAPLEANLNLFDDDREILPGIHSMNTPGHTPGHCSYLLESDDHHLLLSGDAANHHVLALKNPHWHFVADYEPDLAIESRIRIFEWASEHDVKVLAYHFPFPGVGYALESVAFEDRWDWIPSM